MLAQFAHGIIEDLSRVRQLQRDRHAQVWGFRFNEALAFFSRNGVGLDGVTTQQQLGEALQGHLRWLQDPSTAGNERLEAQIISYLKIRGQYHH